MFEVSGGTKAFGYVYVKVCYMPTSYQIFLSCYFCLLCVFTEYCLHVRLFSFLSLALWPPEEVGIGKEREG